MKQAAAMVIAGLAVGVLAAQPASATPSGPAVGTATMQVLGSGQATVHYRINGEAEQTEVVTLPWSKPYQVYDEVETSVTADGATGCSITMNGMLAAFKNEPNPTCSFAYYG